MSVSMLITTDPHNPDQTPRTELAANITVAAVSAMRLGLSCVITTKANMPVVGSPARTVRIVAGVVCEGTTLQELAWWQAEAGRTPAPTPADLSDSSLSR